MRTTTRMAPASADLVSEIDAMMTGWMDRGVKLTEAMGILGGAIATLFSEAGEADKVMRLRLEGGHGQPPATITIAFGHTD